jgi:hypothetical protein
MFGTKRRPCPVLPVFLKGLEWVTSLRHFEILREYYLVFVGAELIQMRPFYLLVFFDLNPAQSQSAKRAGF